jgi:hypothetical protein
MDAFLTNAAFAGAVLDVNASSVTFVGQARFNGCITFCNWPRRDVEALLPKELELAANAAATADVHPVAFIFGEQTEGATIFAGIPFPMGVRYHEFAMAIPFVKHRRGRYLHSYVPRMYSSYFPAVWHGNTYYGLAKEMATLWWQGPIFLITAKSDTLLLHAAVESTGRWSAGGSCDLPNFQATRAIFALPVVGRKSDGTYVCSYFGWDFGAATVRPADACVSIDAPLTDGLDPRRCHDVASGTFEVRDMVWKLSWPSVCRFE